jgi:hypothetical protein
VAETELDRLAKQLGPRREDVRRLLDMAARSADGARIARNLLRARLRQAGLDPDDSGAFALVQELPPGHLQIGRAITGDQEGPVFALPEGSRSNIQHTAIVGETRYGKTYLLLSIARQHISAGGRSWIFDLEGEYNVLANAVAGPFKPLVLAPRHLRINFFEPPAATIPWRTWMADLALLFRQEMFLRDGSINLFDMEMRQVIEGKGLVGGRPQFPSLAEVFEHFRNLKFGGGKVRSGTWLESLTNRLGALMNLFEETANVKSSNMLPRLASQSVIFHLRGLRGLPLQFFVNFMLTWLSRYREVVTS